MTDILKIAASAVICVVLYSLVKSEKPEFAVFVQLAGVAVVGLLSIDKLTELIDSGLDIMNKSEKISVGVDFLVKAVGTAVVADIAAGICRDNGATALSGTVELAAKLIILMVSMPMINEAVELIKGLV